MEFLNHWQQTFSLSLRNLSSRFLPIKESILSYLKIAARFPFKTRRRKIISFSFLSLLFLLFLLVIVIPAILLYPPAASAKVAITKVKAGIEAKDLEATQSALNELDSAVSQLEQRTNHLSYLKFIPLVNLYFRDGSHLLSAAQLGVNSGLTLTKTLTPYASVLGLKSGFSDQITVEQRLGNVLAVLPKVAQQLDAVWANLLVVEDEVGAIDPKRYPENFAGVKVRFWLEEAQRILADAKPLLSQGRNILEEGPRLLGAGGKRTYLVLYQNNSELRATGGFMTGFSLLTVDNGQVLANKFLTGADVARTTPYLTPPAPLAKYLGVRTWYFQDINFSPDFPTTAQKALEVWKLSKLPDVSGVIAINTAIASRLLDVVGPIRLAGYDLDLSNYNLPSACREGGRDFTAANLTCRLEFYVEKAPKGGAQASTEQRKTVLALITDALIQKVTKSSAENWIELVDLSFNLLNERNVMIYSVDNQEQQLLKDLGYAGEIKSFAGDYLHVNDSNLGGYKTNLYLQEEVEQELTRLDSGIWQKTVKIKYYNPQPLDNWLSYYYKDFVRLYVPLGSKLVSINGEMENWGSWEELGKTVFGAYFVAAPQEEHFLTFIYDLPSGAVGKDFYQLLVQKQSGTNIGLVGVKIDGKMETFDLRTDQYIKIAR